MQSPSNRGDRGWTIGAGVAGSVLCGALVVVPIVLAVLARPVR